MKNNTKNSLLTLAILAVSSSAFGWSSPEVAMILDEGPNVGNYYSLTLDRYDVPTGQSLGSISLGSQYGNQDVAITLESSTVVDVYDQAFGLLTRYDWTNGNIVSSTSFQSFANYSSINNLEVSNGGIYTDVNIGGIESQIYRLNSDGTETAIGARLEYGVNAFGTNGNGLVVADDGAGTYHEYSISGANITEVGTGAVPTIAAGLGIGADGTIASSENYIVGNTQECGLGSVSTFIPEYGTYNFLAMGHGNEAFSINHQSGGSFLNDFDVTGGSDVPKMHLALGTSLNNPVGLVVYAAPEPKSFLLMGMGLIGLVALKRRRA